MGKASNLKDMVNSLDLNPLCNDGEINNFYVDTADARGTDAAANVEYILRTGATPNKKFLFAGHTGSGKSTELFKLAEKMKDKFFVVYFSISEYVNFIDVSCSDLILSMLKSLVDTVASNGIDVDQKCLENIINYWKVESIITDTEEGKAQIEGEVGLGFSFYKIISSQIRALFQQSNTIKTETTTRVDKTMPQFLTLINAFIKSIKINLNDKDLLIIVDDLDKLGENEAYDIFKDHSVVLTSIEANVIYTFPVFMHYNKDYRYISMNFDESIILSMVMVNQRDGKPFKEGRSALREIVLKRAEESLFEKECIDFAIKKSGGSIRSMLRILRLAAVIAGIRCEKTACIEPIITKKDLESAYTEHKNSLKRTITIKHVELLKEIYEKKTTTYAEDTDLVMDLFKTFSIIEYNCERWCDLNPAVLDYLIEIHEIQENKG